MTGLNPQPGDEGVHLHWRATSYEDYVMRDDDFVERMRASFEDIPGFDFDEWLDRLERINRTSRIPNTAIVADLDKQTPATFAVTHYYDIDLECCDCKRRFIFFAEEQKYWYEELGFNLASECVRCVECRKIRQRAPRPLVTYELLYHVQDRDEEQNLEMAEACLKLIEEGIFNRRKAQVVRMLFNGVPKDSQARSEPRFAELWGRLLAIEGEGE